MDGLLTLVVLGLVLLLAGFAFRSRQRVAKWLNCPSAAYEESPARRKTILKRRAEDALAELAYMEDMEKGEAKQGED